MSVRTKVSFALMPFSGLIAGFVISLMGWIIARSFDSELRPDFVLTLVSQFLCAVPFSILFLLRIPMRFFVERKKQKKALQHLTFIATTAQGVIGNLVMVATMPDAYNSFVTPLWFAFGFIFFNLGGARSLDVILYGSIYFFGLTWGMMSWNISIGSDEVVSFLLIAFQAFTFMPIALMFRGKVRAIQHAFRQLEKVFYAHQIALIKRGKELEQTMPTEPSEAYVISFDIIESSRIEASMGKELFRAVFKRCNAIMIEGYDGRQMLARAYRIKEMGDGFLCSVGYPFRSPFEDLATESLRLAWEFHQAFTEEAHRLDPTASIHCGVGIAYGAICGFYPETRPQEYDLYGHSIVLAKRYENTRKVLLAEHLPASIIVLQDQVFSQLAASDQVEFKTCDLKETGIVIRDDPSAHKLFYRLMP